MDLPALLELRKQVALDSPSDSLFYQNIHAYIKVIMEDNKARSIVESAEREYTKGHTIIWEERSEDENVIDERARSTYRLERFNLYASNFVTLFVRIYLPIEDFITTDEPTSQKHPVAIVALYGLNSDHAKEWCNGRKTIPPKEAKKMLQSYNKWFENKRKEYADELLQFHTDFLTEYHKPESKELTGKPVGLNIPLHLNRVTGDFSFNGVAGNLNPTSQPFKVLVTLLNKSDFQATYLEVIQSYRPGAKEASKVLKTDMYKVILKLKKELGITEEDEFGVLRTVKGLGYRLVFKDTAEKED